MTRLDCVQVEELLGAYARDALPRDEMRSVESHLTTCPEQAQTAEALRKASSWLALLVDEAAPSAELRERTVGAIRPGAASQPAPQRPMAAPTRRVVRPRLPQQISKPAAGLAGALALAVVVGMLIGYRLSQSAVRTWTFQGTGGATAQLVYYPDRKVAIVSVAGLGGLNPGQVYEMWVIDRQGNAVDEGVSDAPSGRIGASLAIDPSRFATFAITIEPGEQPAPTSTPILAGRLTM